MLVAGTSATMASKVSFPEIEDSGNSEEAVDYQVSPLKDRDHLCHQATLTPRQDAHLLCLSASLCAAGSSKGVGVGGIRAIWTKAIHLHCQCIVDNVDMIFSGFERSVQHMQKS